MNSLQTTNHITLIDSDGRVPRDVSIPTLHHMCANRARECWGLWNEGYPVARIVDHYPAETDYHIVLDANYHTFALGDTEALEKIRSRPESVELVTFLIDLLRLEEKGLAGRFDLSFGVNTISYGDGRHYQGLRLLLLPNLTDIREDVSVETTDVLPLAKLAAKICLSDQSSSLTRCQSIKSILSRVKGLTFRKDWETIGTGKLIVNIDEQPHRLWVESGGECYRIKANSHGFWMPAKNPDKNAVGLEIPVEFSPYSDCNYSWIEAGLRWENTPRIWNNGQNDRIIRNILGTLAAELQHAENSCYKYTLENFDKQRNLARVRLERRDGNGNAEDLWETAIQEKEMTVAVNQSSGVFDWGNDDLWSMERVHESDPFLLTISSRNNSVPSETGYLRLASVPQKALMNRKRSLIERGVHKEVVRNLLRLLGDWKATHDWRLSCRASLQALQGPPGTGKTWTATHIICDLLEQNPCARILVCSKEHLALNHLAEQIRTELNVSEFDVVRAISSKERSDDDFNKELSTKTVAKRLLDELSFSKENMLEKGKLATWVSELALKTASVVCTTTTDRTIEDFQKLGVTFDFAIIEEAGKSYPSELIGPLSISMNTLLIGDHLQLPPFELREIQEAISECFNQGIRSVSENKRRDDSINRELIEMSVSKRDIGDLDRNLAENEVTDWLQPFGKIHSSVGGDILTQQWRMFQGLSDTIGEIFYKGPFESKKSDSFDDLELPGVFGEHAGRLLLMDNARSEEGRTLKSYSNKSEADSAAKALKQLLDEKIDAVSITPYKGQVSEIQNRLPKEYRDKVRTVDGFQGKEADFIILSLVRNNKRTSSSRRWGFFRDPRRINVALSRAREGLLVITSINHIEGTDWDEEEGQLSYFVDAVRQRGIIIGDGR